MLIKGTSRMHLMYTLDAAGKRVYTLKKVVDGRITDSAHPARFSPDDTYSRCVYMLPPPCRSRPDGWLWELASGGYTKERIGPKLTRGRHRVTIKKRHNLLPFQAGGAASTLSVQRGWGKQRANAAQRRRSRRSTRFGGTGWEGRGGIKGITGTWLHGVWGVIYWAMARERCGARRPRRLPT